MSARQGTIALLFFVLADVAFTMIGAHNWPHASYVNIFGGLVGILALTVVVAGVTRP